MVLPLNQEHQPACGIIPFPLPYLSILSEKRGNVKHANSPIKNLNKKGILRPSKGILLGGLYVANDERKKAVTREVAKRYQGASKKQRGAMLGGVATLTGYHRTYASWLLKNFGRKVYLIPDPAINAG